MYKSLIHFAKIDAAAILGEIVSPFVINFKSAPNKFLKYGFWFPSINKVDIFRLVIFFS